MCSKNSIYIINKVFNRYTATKMDHHIISTVNSYQFGMSHLITITLVQYKGTIATKKHQEQDDYVDLPAFYF